MRMPAEWENPDRILITWPDSRTDWDYIIEEAGTQFARIVGALNRHGIRVVLICGENPEDIFRTISSLTGHEVRRELVTVVNSVDFNDTWTRDYGPLTVEKDGRMLELDFGFNGWGLKFAADHDNLVNLSLARNGILDMERYRNHRDFTLEGGSVESDGNGTVLTTTRCLTSPNRNGGKTKEEIEPVLAERLGARRVLWLDHGMLEGDDTDNHVDTLARIAPCDTILYIEPPKDRGDVHFEELDAMRRQLESFKTEDGRPYRLIPLPFPDAVYDEEGNRLPATYANYLVTGSHLFVPFYSQPDNDMKAVAQISKAFPDHEIVGVECSTLLRQHGSLHCSTMQLY